MCEYFEYSVALGFYLYSTFGVVFYYAFFVRIIKKIYIHMYIFDIMNIY